jgi:hypothetical protein
MRGHVLEPRDTWQKYLEPKHRNDAIRFAMTAETASFDMDDLRANVARFLERPSGTR